MTTIEEFLKHSNWIEREYSDRAFKDAVKAWDYAYARRKEPLSLKHILKIHNLLMKNIRPDIAGNLRTCDVYIGGERKEFVSMAKLKIQLKRFTTEFGRVISHKNSIPLEELEKEIRENHVMFEGIHPFEDGNGRSGRILYNLLRQKCGLPVHVIHGWAQGEDEFHKEQAEYYGWFRKNDKVNEGFLDLLLKII